MKILILRVSAIGDVVHTLPAIHLIKTCNPQAQISWVVQKKAANLIKNNQLLNRIWILPNKFLKPKNWGKTISIIKEIRKERWDTIIDFQGILKTSILLCFLKGKKFGFDAINARDSFSSWFTHKHVKPIYTNIIQKNLALASSVCTNIFKIKENPTIDFLKKDLSLFVSKENKQIAETWLQQKNIKQLITIAPNTTWESKMWPDDCWQEFLSKLITTIEQPISIALAGTTFGEQAKNLAIFIKEKKLPIHIVPSWNLQATSHLISKSNLLIAPDTGLLHIADFIGTQSIGIFGPTKAKMHGPFLYKKNIRTTIQVDCPHNQQKTHGQNKKSGTKSNCMYKLSPDGLLEKVLELV